VRWAVLSHLGSAHRLSQPLSGFLAGPSFVALFRATTVPGILPSEHFPHKDRGPLSRPLAPLQLSTSVLKCAGAWPFAPGFTDVHAFTRLPGSPDDYGRPFGRPRPASRLPRARAQRNHLVPPASPTSRLSSPCKTVPVTPGCPSAPGRDSRGFFPFEAFSFHALDPRPARSRGTEHAPCCPKTQSRDSKDR